MKTKTDRVTLSTSPEQLQPSCFLHPAFGFVMLLDLIEQTARQQRYTFQIDKPQFGFVVEAVSRILSLVVSLNSSECWNQAYLPTNLRQHGFGIPAPAKRASNFASLKQLVSGGLRGHGDLILAMDLLHEICEDMILNFEVALLPLGTDWDQEMETKDVVWAMQRYKCAAYLPAIINLMHSNWIPLRKKLLKTAPGVPREHTSVQ